MSEHTQHEASRPRSPAAPHTPPAADTLTDASNAVSNTNISQMTTSTPQVQNDGNKWTCEVCTYENFPLSRKCTMCRAGRPGVGEDIFRLQAEGASALPPPPPPPPPAPSPPPPSRDVSPPPTHTHQHPHPTNDAGAECAAERLRPLRISSPQNQAASSVPKWACATCTYENWPKSLKCAMCGAAPPQAAEGGAGAGAATGGAVGGGGGGAEGGGGGAEERALTRKTRNNADLLWLQACLGVVEGCPPRVEAYLRAGGDPARALTPPEVALLDRASAFDAGHTLVHLAIRFQRQDILASLLARISGGGPGLKRSPSYVAPDLAAAIRRHMAGAIRHKKGAFPARYINEFCTFSLPAEIEELPGVIQEQLFAELLDRDAQSTLEGEGGEGAEAEGGAPADEPPAINWSAELADTLASRLYALWNRSAGDCLPDAVAQAAYGVFDRHNALRRALADTLNSCARAFYERWQAWERLDASALHYAPSDTQLRAEWSRLLAAADSPGTALHQLHVFALAHVMRRPLIVYGVNVVTSFRGEPLGYARFQGIYLPLLWEPEFCSRSPLCLGYTRGHFSALVPMEPYPPRHTYICPDRSGSAGGAEVVYLPLTDADGKLLPVHFLTPEEMGSAEALVRRWTCAVATRGGVLAARQQLHPRPLLVAQMVQEWLNHYRRLAQQARGPFPPRLHLQPAELSSEPDTDDE